ncbi:MAG TPA: hypothetical protein VG603_05905 [Chitinophagales bacterium]|nr:hypothetical protein [Chitinophagales bacterium]
MKKDKETWINEVLGSVERIKPAEPMPGFYGRVLQKAMETKMAAVIPMPVVYRAAAGLLIIIALNTFTCIAASKTIHQAKVKQFANEFSLTQDYNYNY